MILILPEFGCRSGEGAEFAGLIASIKCALASEARFETRKLTFRVLGNCLVIEGAVDVTGAADHVRRLAEDVAGAGRVIVRISCPRD